MPEHEHAAAPASQEAATATAARQAGPRSPVELAFALQRTAGNAATARVLSRFVSPQARTSASGQDDRSLSYQRHTGSVFVRPEGEDVSGVDANDIQQGQLGDC